MQDVVEMLKPLLSIYLDKDALGLILEYHALSHIQNFILYLFKQLSLSLNDYHSTSQLWLQSIANQIGMNGWYDWMVLLEQQNINDWMQLSFKLRKSYPTNLSKWFCNVCEIAIGERATLFEIYDEERNTFALSLPKTLPNMHTISSVGMVPRYVYHFCSSCHQTCACHNPKMTEKKILTRKCQLCREQKCIFHQFQDDRNEDVICNECVADFQQFKKSIRG